MIRRALVAPLLCLALQTAGDHPRPEPRYFRYQRQVHLAQGAVGQTCSALDTSVLMHATPMLTDVRLFSGAREVPYALQIGRLPNTFGYERASLLNLGTRDNNVVFDAHINTPSYGTLELSVDKRDFVASVVVSGSQSADGSGATQLGTFTIFDLTSQQLHRSTVLHLPPSTFPYLHFTVIGPLVPGDIRGVSVVGGASQGLTYQTIAETSTWKQKGRHSVATFDLPGRVSVDRVEIVPVAGTGNFNRSVSIALGDPGRVQPAQGAVYRIHTTQGGRQIDQEQFTVDASGASLPDSARARWTVTVDNGDDPPLAIRAIRLQMRERTMCFDVDSTASYTLYYGDSVLAAPRYDYASLFRIDASANSATLGPEQQNPSREQRADTRPFTERHPGLLWGALILVIGVLGVVAVRTASRIDPSL